MHIKNLNISKLFGRFDYTFNFSISGEKLNLIHGLNGSGKTKVLDILYLICQRDLAALEREPFSYLIVEFSNGSKLEMNRSDLEDIDARFYEAGNKVPASLKRKRADISTSQHRSRADRSGREELLRFFNRHFPHLQRIEPDRWIDQLSNRVLNLDELFFEYQDKVPGIVRKRYLAGMFFYDIKLLPKINSRFIDTKRLIYAAPKKTSESRYIDEEREEKTALQNLSENIALQVRKAIAEYASKTQILDLNYVEKISAKLSGSQHLLPSIVRQRLELLREKEESLHDAGLLEGVVNALPMQESLFEDNQPLLHIINLHCENTEEKLATFNDLNQKITSLVNIIEKRFSYKNIKISTTGIIANDKETGQPIDLESLSSGEQHELYLFADLIFNSDSTDILFIDEPEISLHIAWQQDFVDDLLQVRKLDETQIFIATHSPSIIGERFSSAFDLQDLQAQG